MDPKAHEINAAIVANVRKHRVLYDPTVPEYSIKKFSKQAWEAVAKATNLAEEDCKFRWRNLRISFLRYNRTKRNSDAKIKPYYLEQDMAFMLPFIRSRPNTIGRPRKSNSAVKRTPTKRLFGVKKEEMKKLEEPDEVGVVGEDSQDIEFEYVYDDNEKSQMVLEYSSKRDTPISIIAEDNDTSPMYQQSFQDTPKQNYYEIVNSSHRGDTDENPDWNFLRSFLPDLQKMSPSQKIKFKLTLCTAISELLYNADSA
uniref:Putative alcohol dehydrogenase transcription factor myb/sant-like protein n=1 Tax=Lutzomyia longipalpis TaxID=7200 RepID=A0A7G3A820_LUTLO